MVVVVVVVVEAATAVVAVVHNGYNYFVLLNPILSRFMRFTSTPHVSESNFNTIPDLRLCLPVG